jgi:hypothetical protein
MKKVVGLRTACNFFQMASFPLLRDKFPNVGNSELQAIMSKMWSALSDIQKQPFIEQASRDKERYQRELEAEGRDPN